LYFYVDGRKDIMNEIGYAFQVLPRRKNAPNAREIVICRRTSAMKRSHISAKKLKKFRRVLLTKRDEILQGATVHGRDRAGYVSAGFPDTPVRMADLAGGSHHSCKVHQSSNGGKGLLPSIEEALARIDAGTYGICDGDGELIAKTRLEMVPWTRYCAKCTRLAQMGLLSSEDSFR
jgi:RNA polymerase-binding transcription factor DksA